MPRAIHIYPKPGCRFLLVFIISRRAINSRPAFIRIKNTKRCKIYVYSFRVIHFVRLTPAPSERLLVPSQTRVFQTSPVSHATRPQGAL